MMEIVAKIKKSQHFGPKSQTGCQPDPWHEC